MDLIQNLISQHGGKFVALLTSRVGLEPQTAERFVPEGVGALVEQLRSGDFDLGQLLAGGSLGSLLARVDSQAVAERADVEVSTAENALAALAPAVLDTLKGQAGGLSGLASLLGDGGKAGGLLSAAKKLFGN